MMDSSVRQLYHIANTGAFTYCLICMEVICKDLNCQCEESHVNMHLNCTNHQENVKFLFKLCVPDPVDEESSVEDHFGIMSRSVFDISDLLGERTCYICCANKKHLVCLLCREEVTETEFPMKKIKKRIDSHLQSDKHLQSVKNTNWMYHFNSHKSFFRFHKSILYCSICKESFQFKDSNLRQFADSHLKNLHVSCIESEKGHALEPQATAETKTDSEEVVSSSDSVVQSNENKAPPSDSSFPPLTKKTKSYTCHLCLADIEIVECEVRYSIANHCINNHQRCYQVQGSLLFKDIICFNERFLDHKVVVKKYPGIKVLSDCVPLFKNNCKYIQVFENTCFCSLCNEIVQFEPDPNDLLRNFNTHFHSAKHAKVLKRKGVTGYDRVLKKKSKNLKRLKQAPKAKKNNKKLKKKKVVQINSTVP